MKKPKQTVTEMRKELEQLRERNEKLELYASFTLGVEVLPDLPKPCSSSPNTSGFTFNAYTNRIAPTWSSVASHYVGYATETETYNHKVSATQNGIALYSTRERALRALRYVKALECAKTLANIDKQIAAERKNLAEVSAQNDD